jgi:formylglycine-generating enzyme required for sulfatase activity
MLSPELRASLNLPGPMEFVEVGNPGNELDPEDGDEVVNGVQNLGSIAESFHIGKYEVTNAQYVEFLNAVAKRDDNGLFHNNMESDTRGGITQSGSSPNLAYTFKSNMHNKPVIYVSFLNACRFCNWLHNGRPSGFQDATTTEDGAYNLTDSVAITNNTLGRNPGARFFLPSENEWYKAAFHQPAIEGGDADNYWAYTTQSNSAASKATADVQGYISNPISHVENWDFEADWNGQNGNVTTVGSGGVGSASFYGAFDMGGNVSEWTDTIIIDAIRNGRRNRGGNWKGGENALRNRYWSWGWLTYQDEGLGFRVAK